MNTYTRSAIKKSTKVVIAENQNSQAEEKEEVKKEEEALSNSIFEKGLGFNNNLSPIRVIEKRENLF